MNYFRTMLRKVRYILAAAVATGATTGVTQLAGQDWTDLGPWGPFVGVTVAFIVARVTPERIDILERYISGKRQ